MFRGSYVYQTPTVAGPVAYMAEMRLSLIRPITENGWPSDMRWSRLARLATAEL